MTSHAHNLKKRMQDILESQEVTKSHLRGNAARNPQKTVDGDRVKVAERAERSIENIMKSNPLLTFEEAETIAKRTYQKMPGGPSGNAGRVNSSGTYAQQEAQDKENWGRRAAINESGDWGVNQAMAAEGEAGTYSSKNCKEHPLECESAAEGARDPDTLKNCKRSNTLGHEMGEKCKQILRMVGEQVGATGVKSFTSGMPYTDLDVTWKSGRYGCGKREEKYGNDLQESEMYYTDIYMKGMAGNNAVVRDTEQIVENIHLGDAKYSDYIPQNPMQGGPYEVRAANCYGRKQADTIYTKAPIMTGHQIDPNRMKQLLTEFFRDKEAFMRAHGEFTYETIAIKGVLIAINEDEEMGGEAVGGGGSEEFGFEDIGMPQPLAASNSTLENIAHINEVMSKQNSTLRDINYISSVNKGIMGKKELKEAEDTYQKKLESKEKQDKVKADMDAADKLYQGRMKNKGKLV